MIKGRIHLFNIRKPEEDRRTILRGQDVWSFQREHPDFKYTHYGFLRMVEREQRRYLFLKRVKKEEEVRYSQSVEDLASNVFSHSENILGSILTQNILLHFSLPFEGEIYGKRGEDKVLLYDELNLEERELFLKVLDEKVKKR